MVFVRVLFKLGMNLFWLVYLRGTSRLDWRVVFIVGDRTRRWFGFVISFALKVLCLGVVHCECLRFLVWDTAVGSGAFIFCSFVEGCMDVGVSFRFAFADIRYACNIV